MKSFNIDLPPGARRHYEVSFLGGVRDIASRIARRYGDDLLFIVCDRTVFRLYGKGLESRLLRRKVAVRTIVLPPGERQKSRRAKERLDDRMLSAGVARDSVVIALGGGVIGDLAGYSAATLLRGIRCVQVPTTLLAQVDSSVGGKVGINHPLGKNLIGAFHQPDAVLIAPGLLRTLPRREYLSGLAEVVKIAMTLDARLFRSLERNAGPIGRQRSGALRSVVPRCVRLKAGVVAMDERESGYRRILNYGHTVGHAIETLSGYRVPHGYAVAVGMLVEGEMAVRMDLMARNDLSRLRNLIASCGLPTSIPGRLTSRRIIGAISHDKKKSGGTVGFTLPLGVGKAGVGIPVPTEVLRGAIGR